MKVRKTISSILILVVFLSCKGDDEPVNQKEKMLTGKNWRLIAAESDPPILAAGQNISDVYAVMPACAKDDLTKFDSDGSVVFDEGPSKCESTDPQTETSDWSFNSDKTSITVEIDSKTVSYEILEISDSRLKVSFVETDEDTGTNHTITATYTAL